MGVRSSFFLYGLEQALSDVLFVVFMTTFFVLRLGCYPYIIWSAHYETAHIDRAVHPMGLFMIWLLYCLLVLQVRPSFTVCCAAIETETQRYCSPALTFFLLRQLFWGGLIIRVLVKLVREGHVEDTRSDDEEEIIPSKQSVGSPTSPLQFVEQSPTGTFETKYD